MFGIACSFSALSRVYRVVYKGVCEITMSSDGQIRTESWMGDLPEELRQQSIINLAVPGSHDSFTASITQHSAMAPDVEPVVRRLSCGGRKYLNALLLKWAHTQKLDVMEQLLAGIRYFDLRLAPKFDSNRPDDDYFYIVHGLYGENVIDILHKINAFLKQHPKEVVILDFQHFYAFSPKDHAVLQTQIQQVFSDKLVPYIFDMTTLTLNNLRAASQQVFIIYRKEIMDYSNVQKSKRNSFFWWPSDSFPNPWPNTRSTSELIQSLNNGLEMRSPFKAFISQCVLTPTKFFVCRHLFSNLMNQCVIPLEKPIRQWLMYHRSQSCNRINIVMSDFIDYDSGWFAECVIHLNFKR